MVFEKELAGVLRTHRHDETLDDERFAIIVIGWLHDYVQKPDVRLAAAAAVEKFENEVAAKDDEATPSQYVDVVVRSVMGVRP